MANAQKFRVTYHLVNGVEVVDDVESESKKTAALQYGHDEIKFVENEDEKFYKFNLKDVVLITVEPR
ncbi:hypothetical protein E2R51_14850 [Jeotgalibacillus sp. S-D1]|uniref:hypothetical protein n=1 Tax=Jeotgalibacillus sp. S-D1 TaxID=2552189 RepID=UPI001059DF62|nr:hypothetical protein [Jeotgalibacillus sp. S-D1]TDL31072.1 hypothetical protein E2R51_14850 [Jeotgalibacillus sp. S-D1]